MPDEPISCLQTCFGSGKLGLTQLIHIYYLPQLSPEPQLSSPLSALSEGPCIFSLGDFVHGHGHNPLTQSKVSGYFNCLVFMYPKSVCSFDFLAHSKNLLQFISV